MTGNCTLKVALTVATCNSQIKEVCSTLLCDVLSKFMTTLFTTRVVFRGRAIFHLFRYVDGYNLRILGSNFSDAVLESAHTGQSQAQYLCALSKYLSGVFLSSYCCFLSMSLIFFIYFLFYFGYLFVCFHLSPSSAWPPRLPCSKYWVAVATSIFK